MLWVGPLQHCILEDRGLEPGPSSSRKTPPSQQGNAESNAFSGDDPQLQLFIDTWPTLSQQIQQQIMLLGEGELASKPEMAKTLVPLSEMVKALDPLAPD